MVTLKRVRVDHWMSHVVWKERDFCGHYWGGGSICQNSVPEKNRRETGLWNKRLCDLQRE